MRVVHIITGLKSGGAERLLLDRCSRTRHQVAVVSLTDGGEIATQLRERGVPVHEIGMRGNKDLAGLLRLRSLLARMKPDVVHVHLYRSLLFGRLAARAAGVARIVATEHSALPDRTEGRPATTAVKAMYWLAEKLGTVTIAVSGETRDVLVQHWGISRNRIVLAPNGVDTARLTPSPAVREEVRTRLGVRDDESLLVTVGRLVPGKRVDLVVEALAVLRERGVRASLVVVGTGAAEEELRARLQALGLGDHVFMVGDQRDVVPYLAAADVYVSASEVETYGIAVVEGFVSGLPLVYTAAPAADDLRRACGGNGRVQQASPTAQSLAEHVVRALEHPVGQAYVPTEVLAASDIVAASARLDDIEEGIV